MAPLSISLGVATETTGLSESEIVLGMSAAFSGPSRGLGIELYRGASAYFTHVNSLLTKSSLDEVGMV